MRREREGEETKFAQYSTQGNSHHEFHITNVIALYYKDDNLITYNVFSMTTTLPRKRRPQTPQLQQAPSALASIGTPLLAMMALTS